MKKIAHTATFDNRCPPSSAGTLEGTATRHLLRVQCPTARSPSVSAWCTRPSWPSRRSATTVRPDPVVVSFYGIGSREQRTIADGSRRAASPPRGQHRPRDARETGFLDTRATWRDRRASRANHGSSGLERPAASPGGAPETAWILLFFLPHRRKTSDAFCVPVPGGRETPRVERATDLLSRATPSPQRWSSP